MACDLGQPRIRWSSATFMTYAYAEYLQTMMVHTAREKVSLFRDWYEL